MITRRNAFLAYTRAAMCYESARLRSPVMRYRIACIGVLLLVISSTSSAQFPWQKPPSRSKKAVADILGPIAEKEPSRDLNIVWVWGIDKLHEKETHEYAWVMDHERVF